MASAVLANGKSGSRQTAEYEQTSGAITNIEILGEGLERTSLTSVGPSRRAVSRLTTGSIAGVTFPGGPPRTAPRPRLLAQGSRHEQGFHSTPRSRHSDIFGQEA